MGSSSRRLSRVASVLLAGVFPLTVLATPSTPLASSPAARAAALGAVASAVDADGIPVFLWGAGVPAAPTREPDAAARWYLERFASAFRTSAGELSAARVVKSQRQPAGGYLVHLRQRVGALDVYGSNVKILMSDDLRLIAISGRPRPLAGASTAQFRIGSQQALANALSHFAGASIAPATLDRAPAPVTDEPAGPSAPEWFERKGTAAALLAQPAPVKAILFPVGDRLVPAYDAQFYAGPRDTNDSAAFQYILAADDGRVLLRRDLTSYEKKEKKQKPVEFSYRVWADPTGDLRPQDGPQQDFTPHPTGLADGIEPAFTLPNLVAVSGLNDPPGHGHKPDPWLPADATETSGNNADAYVDHRAPDGLTAGDFRATTTGPRSFDRTYDTSADPLASADQSQASVTQAFYTVNWLHDYWYDSGFNEAAGNAQKDNFGRGGVGGDAMRVEIQDNDFGGSRNNANMSTPADGMRPRMQMFVWTGRQTVTLTLTPGGERAAGTASFGPQEFDVMAAVTLANDGTPSTSDACQPLVGFPAGQIALADRGTCTFVLKAANAQAAGAAGLIVANNAPGAPPGLGGTDPTNVLPVCSISQSDGAGAQDRALGRRRQRPHAARPSTETATGPRQPDHRPRMGRSTCTVASPIAAPSRCGRDERGTGPTSPRSTWGAARATTWPAPTRGRSTPPADRAAATSAYAGSRTRPTSPRTA